MAFGRVFRGALLCASLLACGERSGDPIVRLQSDKADAGESGSGNSGSGGQAGSLAMAGSGGGGAPAGGVAGGGFGNEASVDPTGLCGACTSSKACGDANDACIRYEDESFCGRDCDEGVGCPDGYTCVQLANSRLYQCVPTDGCAEPPVAPPSLEVIREYLLGRVNAERADRGRASLEPSTCLDELAQQSALAYAQTDEPLGKFVKECDPIWPDCDCGWSAEAEVAVAHLGLDWQDAIERALGSGRTSDDRFVDSFLDFNVTHAGIGFYLSADEAWIALSFS